MDYEGVAERCDTYSHDYVRSVIDAGGLPILLPLNDESEAGQEVFEALLDLVDGVFRRSLVCRICNRCFGYICRLECQLCL